MEHEQVVLKKGIYMGKDWGRRKDPVHFQKERINKAQTDPTQRTVVRMASDIPTAVLELDENSIHSRLVNQA